jgi:hypothetical protein
MRIHPAIVPDSDPPFSAFGEVSLTPHRLLRRDQWRSFRNFLPVCVRAQTGRAWMEDARYMHRGRPGSREERRDPRHRIDQLPTREVSVSPCVIVQIGGGFTGSADGGMEPVVGHRECFTAALRRRIGPEQPRWVAVGFMATVDADGPIGVSHHGPSRRAAA